MQDRSPAPGTRRRAAPEIKVFLLLFLQKKKALFLKKKNQKDFRSFGASKRLGYHLRIAARAGQECSSLKQSTKKLLQFNARAKGDTATANKSFLLLFFKKEVLSGFSEQRQLRANLSRALPPAFHFVPIFASISRAF
jgi:hypothetical protein